MVEYDEEPLAGNVGGAVRIGQRVHRPTGPWTPAVHALLDHLSSRLPGVPRVHGFDAQGREVVDFLPGDVVDQGVEALSPARLVALVDWTHRLHEAASDFRHPGPWRLPAQPGATMIGHNDIAPYNACWHGDELAGVFDWDMAGPTTPLLELAFMAWNCVPLWADVGTGRAAERLRLIAQTYDGYSARELLHAVPQRIQIMVEAIPAHAATDSGIAHLMTLGEPSRTQRSLDDLLARLPGIDKALGT